MRAPLLATLTLVLAAQEPPLTKVQEAATFHPAVPTPDPGARRKAFEARKGLAAEGSLAAVPWRAIGPIGQGGRVVALAVDDRRPEVWIAAFATGGLWITRNDGATWDALFDHEEAFAIGDVAVVWGAPGEPRTLWVGTGEANASRSSYAGAGVFRSDDGGKTWRNTGLPNSHRIARIVVHPANPDTVYVAAQGPLYTEGGERGVFKTTDGGRTWAPVLQGGPRTGAVDLLLDWRDPETVYAALWEKDRKPWNFLESGPGSGIHKSVDGGRTWTRLGGGFPTGEGTGRIGLAQSRQDPRKLFALLDNQNLRGPEETDPFEDKEKLSFRKLAGMSREDALKYDAKAWKAFLKDNGFHPSHTAEKVLEHLKSGAITVKDLAHYNGDFDTDLQRTDIVGAEVYASEDGGTTWKKTHDKRLDSVYSTYGYYFGQIRVDPANDRNLYLLGFPAIKSEDGGRTFKGINGENWDSVHPDHHALWIDPRDGRRLVLGNDGGLNISMDGGEHWRAVKNLAVGQFYTIAVDNPGSGTEPFRVYGGLQDNGVKRGPATPLKPGQAADAWTAIYGGDGGYVVVNPKDNATVYAESQFGVMARLEGGKRKAIRPAHKLKETPFRFNWMTPITLSPHSPDILYTGTQKVLRSLDRGDTWTEISGDLSSGRRPFIGDRGDVPYGTLTTLSESPKRFGLLYAGTDEGRIWVSRDGGFAWTEAVKGLPAGRWASRVEASRHAEGTVYATFTAARNDTTEALVFRSADYGATWTSIAGNLPGENINVLREDAANPDLLYLGTDFGVFATVDGGRRWDILGAGLPNVPVHDLALHAGSGTLVAGTHGRSAWTAPVAGLSAWTAAIRAKYLHLFEVKPFKAEKWWKEDRPGWWTRREPEAVLVWFHAKAAGPATLRLEDEKGVLFREWKLDARPGLNRVEWDLQVDRSALKNLPEGRRAFVEAGAYKLRLSAGSASVEQKLKIEAPKENPDSGE